MTLSYQLAVDEDGQSTVSVFAEGEVLTVRDDHPNYARITKTLMDGGDPRPYFSIASAFAIDSRVEVRDHEVTFDGEAVGGPIARTILRYSSEGRDPSNLVKFLERLMTNPSRRSREQLYGWLEKEGLTVDKEGYFLGWKGVSNDLHSLTSGKAEVDGVKHDGKIPNHVGSVVSMPRTQVQDDPTIGCSHGLHVGSYNYAKGFGCTLLEVRVDPADVVSVPSNEVDKLRCCRYEVLAVHENPDRQWSQDYEPDGDGYDVEEAFEDLGEHVPETFLSRLKSRILGGGKS